MKKKRSRAAADDGSDEDDDVVATKVTKAPNVDQEKLYSAFMKANNNFRTHRMFLGTVT